MEELPPPPPVEVPKHGFLGSGMFLLIFFLITPIALAVSTFALMTVAEKNTIEQQERVLAAQDAVRHVPKYTNLFSSSEPVVPNISVEMEVGDARVEIISQYLERYNSPLLPLAEYIVNTSDKYELDFRLITAIAQQESNLCKRIPPGTHNCWGWGIHSEGTLGFRSYEEAIETVSKGLKENYINKGYTTPDIIMTKYTPSSNGSWAAGVNQFMNDMQ